MARTFDKVLREAVEKIIANPQSGEVNVEIAEALKCSHATAWTVIDLVKMAHRMGRESR